jgi:integrase/recombinase XerD
VLWYRQRFHAFEGAMDGKAAIGERIVRLRKAGLTPVSVNTYLRTLNAFFRWAHAEGHLSELLRVAKLKEEQKVISTLAPEQISRLIDFKPHGKSQQRLHTLSCLLLDSGLRIDEALSLRSEDVDLENFLLRVHGKGRKHRVIPISVEMRKLMWRWMKMQPADSGLVFPTRTGTKLNYRNTLGDFKQLGNYLKITGVRFSFHTLRHTFAVNYIRNGGDVFRLQRILGHSTLEMTRRYVNLQTSDLQAVHSKLSLLSRRGYGTP